MRPRITNGVAARRSRRTCQAASRRVTRSQRREGGPQQRGTEGHSRQATERLNAAVKDHCGDKCVAAGVEVNDRRTGLVKGRLERDQLLERRRTLRAIGLRRVEPPKPLTSTLRQQERAAPRKLGRSSSKHTGNLRPGLRSVLLRLSTVRLCANITIRRAGGGRRARAVAAAHRVCRKQIGVGVSPARIKLARAGSGGSRLDRPGLP
jgi:hypothetical protein